MTPARKAKAREEGEEEEAATEGGGEEGQEEERRRHQKVMMKEWMERIQKGGKGVPRKAMRFQAARALRLRWK